MQLLLIGAAFIIPMLLPKPTTKITGPRINEIGLQSACEGSPIHRCYGGAVRVAGTVLWVSDLIEVKHKEKASSGKGGGGGGTETTTYTYFIDIVMGVCVGAREIEKIWADGKLIYDTHPTVISVYNNEEIRFDKAGSYMILVIEAGELPLFETDLEVSISGAGVFSANKGNFVVVSSTATELKVRNPNGIACPAGAQVCLGQFPGAVPSGLANSMTVYNGDYSQIPNSLMESYLGAGNVPAYRGICYVVFERLKLTDYGNRVPNFEFLVVPVGYHPT